MSLPLLCNCGRTHSGPTRSCERCQERLAQRRLQRRAKALQKPQSSPPSTGPSRKKKIDYYARKKAGLCTRSGCKNQAKFALTFCNDCHLNSLTKARIRQEAYRAMRTCPVCQSNQTPCAQHAQELQERLRDAGEEAFARGCWS